MKLSWAAVPLALLLSGLAGCAGGGDTTPSSARPVGGEREGIKPPAETEHVIMNPREAKDLARRSIDLLAYFSSNDPKDWQRATRELRAIGKPFVPDDVEALMKIGEGQDPNKAALARVELARRGKIARVLQKLESKKYDDWKTARFEMQRMGGDGLDYLVSALTLKFRSVNTHQYEWARVELLAIGERSIPILREFLLAKGSDNVLREQCSITLCRLGPKGHAPILEAAAAKDRWTRVAAAKGIGVSDTEELAGSLKTMLLSDPAWEARAEAALAFGKMKSEAGVQPCIQALKDADSLVRREAARALGEIGSLDAVPALIEVLEKDPKSRHSELSMMSLQKISGLKYGPDPVQWKGWWGSRGGR